MISTHDSHALVWSVKSHQSNLQRVNIIIEVKIELLANYFISYNCSLRILGIRQLFTIFELPEGVLKVYTLCRPPPLLSHSVPLSAN